MNASVSMRSCAAQFCAALLAVMLCGCCSISVTHEFDDGVGNGPLGGRYSLDGVDAPLAAGKPAAPFDFVEFVSFQHAMTFPLPSHDKHSRSLGLRDYFWLHQEVHEADV